MDDLLLIASLIVVHGYAEIENFNGLSRDFYHDEDLWAFSEKKHKHLMYAAYKGNLKRVKFLVERCSANVNKRNIIYWSSINYAMDEGHLDVVRYLMEKKAYPGENMAWKISLNKEGAGYIYK